jgi:hypothetical protein
MRLELADGQSATLRDRLTYGQAHGVRAAYFAIERDPALQADVDMALVRAYVSAWHVLDVDGNAVSLDAPEQAPDDVIQAIAQQAADLFGMEKAEAEVPKAGDGSLPSTPAESHNGSMTLDSETSSFSTLTPVGPTQT